MKTLTLGISMAALVLGGTAIAAPAQDQAREGRDPNRVMTRAEVQAKSQERFARMDANKDGKLDRTDWQALRETRKEKRFARLDTNNDGQISKAEFMADNGPMKQGRGQWGHRRGGGMMGKMAGAQGDRSITQADFTARALQRFDAMDANKDGQVTPQERAAAREQMKAKWQQMRAQREQG